MARRFALVSMVFYSSPRSASAPQVALTQELGRASALDSSSGSPRSASAPQEGALTRPLGRAFALDGHFRRYEIEGGHRERTHGGRVADLLARAGDLAAAVAALLADWRPEGGPAGFPPPPRPRGAPTTMRAAA